MSPNKLTVQRYIDGFNKSDHLRKGGGLLSAVFCDVFVMQQGKIRHLTTYLAEIEGST